MTRTEEVIKALVNRHGGESIDILSLYLVERVVNDTALLLGADVSFLRDSTGITKLLADRGRY